MCRGRLHRRRGVSCSRVRREERSIHVSARIDRQRGGCRHCAAPSARAQSIVGAPIIVPGDNITITLEFLSADAAYTGELSFLGAGTPFIITMPAIDTGEVGLGQQTFVNQTGESGSVVALEGVFNAGDVLHFGYRVFALRTRPTFCGPMTLATRTSSHGMLRPACCPSRTCGRAIRGTTPTTTTSSCM